MRQLFATAALLAFAAPALAQTDPSNPGGAPLTPSQAPTTQPTQGEVIRNAAPGRDLDPRQEPRAPSVTSGVEEPQRTTETKPVRRLPKSPSADPAPIDQPPAAAQPPR